MTEYKVSRLSETVYSVLTKFLGLIKIGAQPDRCAALPITGKDKFDCIYYMYFRQ